MTKRILVTGSRDWEDATTIFEALNTVVKKWGTDVVIVHGGAKGADTLAGAWAKVNFIAEEVHLANWKQYGRSAGMIRNAEMAKTGADICLAFSKNESSGTQGMIKLAKASRIPVFIYEV